MDVSLLSDHILLQSIGYVLRSHSAHFFTYRLSVEPAHLEVGTVILWRFRILHFIILWDDRQ